MNTAIRPAEPAHPADNQDREFAPDEAAIRARYDTLVAARHFQGTRAWRSMRTVLGLVPVLALNAALPNLPGGQSLTGVGGSVSGAVFGTHLVLFGVAALVANRTSPDSTAYRLVNRLESAVWLLGSGVLLGISGSARSIYWLHIGLVVVLTFPMISSHRALRRVLAASVIAAVALLLVTGTVADALFASLAGGMLVFFHNLSMRIAPASLMAQARSELLAERASEVLVRAEQDRIRRELHDGLGAELTSLLWTAQTLGGRGDAEVQPLIERIQTGLGELRLAMHSVAPTALSPDRLTCELKRVMSRLASRRDVVAVECLGETRGLSEIDGSVCVAVLKASQECARNAFQHGGATHVRVRIRYAPSFVLEVEDDGCGDPDNFVEGDGIGGVRERMRSVGGDVSWQRRDSGGVLVRLELRSLA